MAEFPALPLWTDAYLADTRHLTTEEHGAYLLLLMEAWRRPLCDLPDNDVVLARLAGLSVDRWAEVKVVVMAFWKQDRRRKVWTQKRLLSERSYVAQKSQSQRDKAAKRWNNAKKGDAAALPKPCPDDAPTPTPIEEREETNVSSPKKRTEKGTRLPDDWRLPREWGEWAVAEGMDEVSVRREAEKFRDYWHAKPGREALKLDWLATWRVWVRTALERMPTRPAKPVQAAIGSTRKDPQGRTWEYANALDGWVEVRG